MKMTKNLFFAVFAMLFIFAVNAQAQAKKAKKSPEKRVENQLKKMTELLELTSDQQTKVKAAIETRITAVDAEREGAESKEDIDRKAIRAAKKAFDTEIKGILNEEQTKKYEAWKAEKKEKRREKRNSKS